MEGATTSTSPAMDFRGLQGKLEEFLDLYLNKKAPQLPKEAKDGIVQFGPWVIVALCVFLVFGLIGILGVLSYGLSWLGAYGYGFGGIQLWLGVLLVIPIIILEGLSVPGLLKKSKKSGWNLLFYAELLNVVYYLFSFSFFGLIGTVIGFYILFQVREYYK